MKFGDGTTLVTKISAGFSISIPGEVLQDLLHQILDFFVLGTYVCTECGPDVLAHRIIPHPTLGKHL